MDFTGYRQIVATFCVVLDIRLLPSKLTDLTRRRPVYSSFSGLWSGLIGSADDSVEEVKTRIMVETLGARNSHLDHFQLLGSDLPRRQRMVTSSYDRGTDKTTERELSQYRLVYFRDN